MTESTRITIMCVLGGYLIASAGCKNIFSNTLFRRGTFLHESSSNPYEPQTPVIVWGVTFLLFGIVITLEILGWGEVSITNPFRFILGPLLIVLGNLAVWSEVVRFVLPQTGGAVGQLKVGKLYRYSRNPQYVADTAILIGWALLCASIIALPVIVAVILVLLIAPFAEEPWLEEQYGQAYLDYKVKVRRYL